MTLDEFCLDGAAVVLIAAAALVLLRTVLGPSILDRSIGLDTLSAICLAAIAVDAAEEHDGELLPILLLLALVGFTGSVCIARFTLRGQEGGADVSGEDGCVGPGAQDPLAGALPQPLPGTELVKRREEGL
jgi:multicomponent Na+:H+ antiporter subunit F